MKQIIQQITQKIMQRWWFGLAPPPPMPLGRWCHPLSHARCDQERKADLANADNSCAGQAASSSPVTKPVPERDPVSVFLAD